MLTVSGAASRSTNPSSLADKSLFNVLIADDHAVVRAGYRQFLQEHARVAEIGEATSGTDALAKLRKSHWHIMLLDISMPDRGGLDILERIRAAHPELKVLVVSGLPERQYAPSVLKMGASGYLPKDMAGPELLGAIDTVMSGQRYVSELLAEELANSLLGGREAAPHEALSAREFQIFLKLASGRTIAEIAEELCLSVKTVSTYRSRILQALSLTNNAELTGYALRNTLIQ